FKTESVRDVIAFLRATLSRVDSSLVREWESMLAGADAADAEAPTAPSRPPDPAADPVIFRARLRAEMHALVEARASADGEEAAASVRAGDRHGRTAARFEAAMEAFIEECGPLRFDHASRLTHLTHVVEREPRLWTVRQTLVAPDGETPWMIDAEVDLRRPIEDDGPLI